jgi:exodeoxyribonuclease VII large subunit
MTESSTKPKSLGKQASQDAQDAFTLSFDPPHTSGESQAIPLSVTELSLALKRHIESSYGSVYLQGEISGCKYHSSGHIYFSLKDDTSVIDAICWRGTPLTFTLVDGMHVVGKGRVTTYGARSKYQIILESLKHAGQGALLQRLEALRIKLTEEGLFSLHRKKPMPRFPRCIGLITSPTGAVIQDMAIRFETRFPCRFLLYPVAVQGASAVSEVLEALAYFHGLSPQPDLLILARGGGSIEDLWPFHDEAMVRAIAGSTIPLISAIGHETDTTLADYAADVRAPTPTAAAEMALPLCSDLLDLLEGYANLLSRSLLQLGQIETLRFHALESRFSMLKNSVETHQQHLDELTERLEQTFKTLWVQAEHRLVLMSAPLSRALLQEISTTMQRLETFIQRMTQAFMVHVAHHENRLNHLQHLLNHLSYPQTLARGFSLVLGPSRQVITHCAKALDEKTLTLQFQDGEIKGVIPF